MRVTIATDHGYMDVNLESFFPTSLVRIRKLFGLMRTGLRRKDKEAVRAWLVARGDAASGLKQDVAEQKADLQEYADRLTSQMDVLKKQLDVTNGRIREMKEKEKTAEAVARMSPRWIKEFDYICGGGQR